MLAFIAWTITCILIQIATASQCQITVVESIPIGVVFPSGSPTHTSVFNGWLHILNNTKSELRIGSSYWSLRGEDVNLHDNYTSAVEGETIFNHLKQLLESGKKLHIVNSQPSNIIYSNTVQNDTFQLMKYGAQLQHLNMPALIGAGILHTKMWVSDLNNFYVGSANMDFRSLTEVKELGIYGLNCPVLSQDIEKIFGVYSLLAQPNAKIPKEYPQQYDTIYNHTNPYKTTLDGLDTEVYFASSPPELCPKHRTSDITSMFLMIDEATEYIYGSVMDLIPEFIYNKEITYWGDMFDRFKAAAIDRKVKIRLLISKWDHSYSQMFVFLQSLQTLSAIEGVDIQVKIFTIPQSPSQPVIPYTRVNHAKYMVNERSAYIGTSNWTADYFTNTCGISAVFKQTNSPKSIQAQVKAVFERDWNSQYASPLQN